MHVRARWLVLSGCLGVVLVGWLVWSWGNSVPPHWTVLVWDVVAVVGLAVGPWLVLTLRRLRGDSAQSVSWWVVLCAGLVAAGGVALGVIFAVVFHDKTELSAGVAGFSILFAGVLGLFGGVLLPWMFLLTRTVARERAARVRAEGRAEMAAHLHDTVLQALTLIQKRPDDPAAVLRLARGTERELRAWLYGSPPAGGDDFAAALAVVAGEVEDRYGVTVELGVVGTCRLDAACRAVLGAVREALTNAAKHAGVRQISVYAEIADGQVFALVRDRGRGFDPSVHTGPDRRGIADSIEDRMRGQGGAAVVRSTPGQGTEVELRMPLAAMIS
jgi:signal transduction histidine kinase